MLFGELFKGLLSPPLPRLYARKFKSMLRWLLTCKFLFPRCLANSHYSSDCPWSFCILCRCSTLIFYFCVLFHLTYRKKQLLFLFPSYNCCFFFVKPRHCNFCRMNQVETWNAIYFPTKNFTVAFGRKIPCVHISLWKRVSCNGWSRFKCICNLPVLKVEKWL